LVNKVLTTDQKRERSLLKTVVKEGVPFLHRPHAYMVYSGGFKYMRDSLELPDFEFKFRTVIDRVNTKLESQTKLKLEYEK
jgi:hypothetical protein